MSAVLSECGRYRYRLTREIAPPLGAQDTHVVTFVMLNPSTADATVDDPTIRRCLGFARDWGYHRLEVVNLYGLRATNPKALRRVADPVGPENDHHIAAVAASADLVVGAWGVHATDDQRVREVMRIIGRPIHALGVTKAGAPRHPRLLRRDAELRPWGEFDIARHKRKARP